LDIFMLGVVSDKVTKLSVFEQKAGRQALHVRNISYL
jgi:hypothetical protein